MFPLENTTKTDSRKFLALIALAGAAASANGAGNYLSYAGTIYYAICAMAILFNYRSAATLLWAAVGAHAVLVGYALWSWQTAQIVPCIYCFGAAGFALLAATIYTRLVAAVLPLLLIAGVWYAWPSIFADKGQPGVTQQPGIEAQYQTPVQQNNNQPAAVNPDAAADTGTKAPTAPTGGASMLNETQQEQTAGTSPAATIPDIPQGNTLDPGVSGPVTPEVKPDSGVPEKPAEPVKPGSS
jgi:hypothetical protein